MGKLVDRNGKREAIMIQGRKTKGVAETGDPCGGTEVVFDLFVNFLRSQSLWTECRVCRPRENEQRRK